MSTIPFSPSPLRSISVHAIDQCQCRVDPRREVARVMLLRMYRASRQATAGQLALLHQRIDRDATYLFSDTGLGLYLLVIKDETLITLYPLDERR